MVGDTKETTEILLGLEKETSCNSCTKTEMCSGLREIILINDRHMRGPTYKPGGFSRSPQHNYFNIHCLSCNTINFVANKHSQSDGYL